MKALCSFGVDLSILLFNFFIVIDSVGSKVYLIRELNYFHYFRQHFFYFLVDAGEMIF